LALRISDGLKGDTLYSLRRLDAPGAMPASQLPASFTTFDRRSV
jgi:hypothetical protein